MSFGVNIPGKTNPIDDLEYKTEKGAKNINYYLKIVPTTYQRTDGSTLTTNQFSVAQHEKVLFLEFIMNALIYLCTKYKKIKFIIIKCSWMDQNHYKF